MQNSSTVVVTQPGPAVVTMLRPPDYMVASIMTCLFCFWPTGLVAIYFSMQSQQAANAGDMGKATQMANNARNLNIGTFVVGVIWIGIVIVVVAVGAASVANGN